MLENSKVSDDSGLLIRNGFELIRIKSSHYRLKHNDGRVTTIPVHKNEDLPKGLLRKILREDIDITVEILVLWIEQK
jgi:predicted RNA binding protein YcfA (HicA-like mRNA interferase family)